VALVETILRLIHPHHLTHLWILGAAGLIGFVETTRGSGASPRGRRLQSPALIADGNHARVDGFVSLGVTVSAGSSRSGAQIADPIIGIVITLVILRSPGLLASRLEDRTGRLVDVSMRRMDVDQLVASTLVADL